MHFRLHLFSPRETRTLMYRHSSCIAAGHNHKGTQDLKLRCPALGLTARCSARILSRVIYRPKATVWLFAQRMQFVLHICRVFSFVRFNCFVGFGSFQQLLPTG